MGKTSHKDLEWEEVSDEILQAKFNGKKMNNGILKLTWVNINSALVYGLVAMAVYIVGVGDLFILNWHMLINTFVLGVLSSLIKNLLTTNQGNFAGMVKVIPDTK